LAFRKREIVAEVLVLVSEMPRFVRAVRDVIRSSERFDVDYGAAHPS